MPPTPADYGPPTSRGALRDLAANLVLGLRAAAFLRVRRGAWRPFPAQIVLLALADLVVTLLLERAAVGADAVLRWDALPRMLLPVPLALLAGWIIAGRARVPGLLPFVATAALAVSFWFDLGWMALSALEAQGLLTGEDVLAAWSAPAFWWGALAAGVAVARLAAHTVRERLADCGWAMLVLALPLWWIPYVPLWQIEDAGGDAADSFAAAREDVIYAQPALLDHVASRLQPQRPGVEDLYFVGAAGYSAEDVFLNEVSLAADMIRTRFDAEGRVALLSNNPGTVRILPVASATSLARVLRNVGDTMDRDEDVLFLFLTSHGSADHRLAMEFWPLQLDDITPPMLKRMLDDAGIRWRVIVISACYAGGFVEPLKDARTLVMTAADAANQSFGCGVDSKLTYFGKAYFDEALRETPSLVGAFETARRTIAARERSQQFTPSNPQLFVGAEIAAKLEHMGQRVAGGPVGAVAANCAATDASAAACDAPVSRAH